MSNLTLEDSGSGESRLSASSTPEFQKPLPCVVGLSETGVTSLG